MAGFSAFQNFGKLGALGGAAGPPPVSQVITSVDTDGWQSVYPSVPAGPVLLQDVFAVRQGFTSTGAVTAFAETLKVTKRVRQPYPNQATLTADKVALSDFVYSTDTLSGVTNSSTLTSPKPIAKWVSLDRDVVGATVTPELVAFHRDGIACVEFRATDGTTTVTAMVSAAIVLGAATDQNAVIGYRAALDLTTLADGLITVHAKVYPRLGNTASVLDSTEKTTRREFSARYYRKGGALLAAPPFAYVSTTGNDTTGVVSTNPLTAAATPCATIGGALARINAVHGPVDGAIIRVMAGTHTFAATSGARTQNIATVLVTRDPDATKAAVILQWGVADVLPRLVTGLNATIDTGCLRIQGVTLDRTGNLTFAGGPAKRLEVQIVDCVFKNNARNATPFGLSDFWWFGTEYQGAANSATTPTPAGAHNMWRGCKGDMGAANIDAYCMVGCYFSPLSGWLTNGALRTGDGSVRAFNRLMFNAATGDYVGMNSNASPVVGVAVVQNLLEGLPNTSYTMASLSADSARMSTVHLVTMHNTITGFWTAGRSNILYDETPGTARTHTLHRIAGNIHSQLNTKHDIFIKDGARTGGWPYLYGVGCAGEFSQFIDAGSGGFAQEYAGAGANIGTSASVRNDPLFVDYKGPTAGGAGAGGGDYNLQSGSPAIGSLSRETIAYDLAGAARNRLSSGAYR